jgi:hypothetical protein
VGFSPLSSLLNAAGRGSGEGRIFPCGFVLTREFRIHSTILRTGPEHGPVNC